MHISAKSAWWLGSGLWLICAAFRRPVVLKFIGGDFAKIYDGYSVAKRRWANATYMRCALILVQTKAIKKRFQNRQAVRWFPNTRDTRGSGAAPRSAARRLIFVSQLRMEKGLREAVEACRDLPSGCCLNVYGPTMANTDLSVFDGQDKAVYRGVLRRGEVADALERHDVLVLPTYWEVEGHPGIVLEALQCGHIDILGQRAGGRRGRQERPAGRAAIDGRGSGRDTARDRRPAALPRTVYRSAATRRVLPKRNLVRQTRHRTNPNHNPLTRTGAPQRVDDAGRSDRNHAPPNSPPAMRSTVGWALDERAACRRMWSDCWRWRTLRVARAPWASTGAAAGRR